MLSPVLSGNSSLSLSSCLCCVMEVNNTQESCLYANNLESLTTRRLRFQSCHFRQNRCHLKWSPFKDRAQFRFFAMPCLPVTKTAEPQVALIHLRLSYVFHSDIWKSFEKEKKLAKSVTTKKEKNKEGS